VADKSRSIQDWERLLEDVEKHRIPVKFLQKLVLRLVGRKQKTINHKTRT
jgi:nitrate reductase beta subunit